MVVHRRLQNCSWRMWESRELPNIEGENLGFPMNFTGAMREHSFSYAHGQELAEKRSIGLEIGYVKTSCSVYYGRFTGVS